MMRNIFASLAQRTRQFHAQAATGQERLWKIWWMAGIPVGWTTSVLVIAGEQFRYAGHHSWGDVLDVVRLLIYLIWFQLAWRNSHNVEMPAWTVLARLALATGLVAEVMF